jgi:hypothetical protein
MSKKKQTKSSRKKQSSWLIPRVILILSLLISLAYNLRCQVMVCAGTVAEIKTAVAPKIWFMIPTKANYNNELVSDYKRLFSNPEEWQESRKTIDTFFFGLTQRQSDVFEPTFLKNKVVPLFNSEGIKIGFDSGVATWLTCRKAQGQRNIQSDLDMIKRIKDAGGTVSYIRLQSTLGKPVPEGIADNCPDYSIDDRINDAVRYITSIHAVYPDIKMGLVDATAAHVLKERAGVEDSYKTTFTKLQNALKAKNDRIEFFLLDTSVENSMGIKNPGILEYSQLLELERFIEDDLKIEFGILVLSYEGGQNDERIFYERTADFMKEYKQLGGSPAIYFPESWYRYPWKALPENSSDSYPHTKFLLNIAKLAQEQSSSPIKSKSSPKKPNAGFALKSSLNQTPSTTFKINGWAYDTSKSHTNLTVKLSIDHPTDNIVDTTITDIFRPELSDEYGFRLTIPPQYRNGKQHTAYVSVQSPETGGLIQLEGSPFTFRVR